MAATTTVVFADLTGSTGVFETLGNSKATQAITRLTGWIGTVCEAHEGRVVKTLGDGVLAVFPDGVNAIEAVVSLQRTHQKRIEKWPENLRMRLQVGVDSGEVVVVDGDCYGDAVNVASRLSDMSGPDQIWASATVVEQLSEDDARCRSLGPINIRGRAEARVVYRIDWQTEIGTDFLTMPAKLDLVQLQKDTRPSQIELSWLDLTAKFSTTQLPIQLGRVVEADFVINDPRVSRIHARIESRNGAFVLTDVSSYGTWVRFEGGSELALRREECALHGTGEIALGAPFGDFTVPTVTFSLKAGSMELLHRPGRSRSPG